MNGAKYQLLPALSTDEYDRLRADIKAHGIRQPIELDEAGVILDGHHRRAIADELGIDCLSITCHIATEDEKHAHVLRVNLNRRHLSTEQMAAVRVQQQATAQALNEIHTQQQIAELLGVTQRTVGNWLQNSNPSNAQRDHRVKLTKKNEDEVLELLESGETQEAVAAELKVNKSTVSRAKKRATARRKRDQKLAENKEKVAAASPLEELEGVYSTIVVDPPWDWHDEGDVNLFGRASPCYATMPMAELLELPVSRLAADDAHLYLWITNRSLPKGFELIERWGFRYITCLTWCKPSYGMGNYFRGQTEQVLFSVRGSLGLDRNDVGTYFKAPRGPGGHSSKPEAFSELVESCSPEPRLEMFARTAREGWVSWGADVGDAT